MHNEERSASGVDRDRPEETRVVQKEDQRQTRSALPACMAEHGGPYTPRANHGENTVDGKLIKKQPILLIEDRFTIEDENCQNYS